MNSLSSTASAAAADSNPLFSVAGKNVLITGGSRGIGYMIAKGFSERGANVLLTSRDEKACAAAAAALKCHYVSSTLSNREGCESLLTHVQKIFGNRLDVLINNAGTSWGEPLESDSKSNNWGFDKVLNLNVKGLFYLSRLCLPVLERSATSEDPARIINIGSVAGLIPQETPTHAYDISKAAVHHLTRKLASEWATRHITVNCMAPGYVPTRMSAGLTTWTSSPGKALDLSSGTPLQRAGRPDDMIGACIFLSSRAGAWCTGLVLPVDGGISGARTISLSSNL